MSCSMWYKSVLALFRPHLPASFFSVRSACASRHPHAPSIVWCSLPSLQRRAPAQQSRRRESPRRRAGRPPGAGAALARRPSPSARGLHRAAVQRRDKRAARCRGIASVCRRSQPSAGCECACCDPRRDRLPQAQASRQPAHHPVQAQRRRQRQLRQLGQAAARRGPQLIPFRHAANSLGC